MDNKTDIKNLINKMDTINLSESLYRDFTNKVSKAEGSRKRILRPLKDAVLRLDLLARNEIEESQMAEVAGIALKDVLNAIQIINSEIK
jgi:hypothetical protein